VGTVKEKPPLSKGASILLKIGWLSTGKNVTARHLPHYEPKLKPEHSIQVWWYALMAFNR
jgi:hypothetical protein